jgi:hypothetical protein
MRDRVLTKWGMALAAALILPLGSSHAEETPKPEDSFDVEPPAFVGLGRGGLALQVFGVYRWSKFVVFALFSSPTA